MKRILFVTIFSLTLWASTAFAQSEPMYTGVGIVDMLKKVNEVVVIMTGYEYTYNGEWLQTMKL